MPRNEDGEYELILGNRQIMSVFFMVAILVGVFFTMGYIVGRNSTPVAVDAAAVPRVEPPPAATAPAERPPEPAREEPAPAGTAAQQPAEAPSVAARAEARTEPVPAANPAPAKRASSAAQPPAAQPLAGKSYLQLAATSEHEAGVLADVLRKKGFKSMVAEIEEKPGTYRVLVGPVEDGTANKTRADLQDAGFPGNAAIRRTF